MLRRLGDEFVGEQQQADIHYELFRLTGAAADRDEALRLARELHRDLPAAQLAGRIAELAYRPASAPPDRKMISVSPDDSKERKNS